MHKTLSYLKFLLQSTNQHGVHSPFIYNFVTQCLYNKLKIPAKKHQTKTEQLISRITTYFNAKHVLTIDNKISTLQDNHYDIITLDAKSFLTLDLEKISTHTYNDSLIIIKNNHANKSTQDYWQYIKNHKSVTVTVDCFSISFVFFRKEQAKEHFKIRL